MPYLEDFTTFPVPCWTQAGTQNWLHYTVGNPSLRANFWSWSAGINAVYRTHPITISTAATVGFKWAHQFNATYPLDGFVLRARKAGSTAWDIWKGKEWGRVKWALPGLFNARNAAMAAVSAGLLIDAKDPTKLKLEALNSFQGVQRRQQVLVDRADLTVIEDFGHHPTALDLTLESLRARYPKHRLVACFEPRSNTAARKVMQDAFREALKKADEVFLPPPHRAEMLGEERFDSEGVAAAITAAGKKGFAPASNDALLTELTTLVKSDKCPRCVIFFSNGAFGGIIQKFAQTVA
jgi:UDP-N-acetylmuramate: L-alanyl-gamma-D-glutamyl-meso-diaminopimelate ligase